MIFIKRAIIALAVSLATACSFTPYQQVDNRQAAIDPADKDSAPVAFQEGQDGRGERNTNAEEDSATSEFVQSTNPYLLARKSVAAAAVKRFDLAVEAMGREDWLAAQEHLVWLTKEYPNYSGPHLNLALTYLQTDKPQEAEASFRGAIVANPKNVDAYNQLAILLREQGRFDAAETQYRAALAVWPDHPDSHRNLGILYDLYMGRLEDALRHYHAYQRLHNAPDRAIAGWIVDIERRLNQIAMQ